MTSKSILALILSASLMLPMAAPVMAQSETIQVADNHRRGGGDWNRDRDRDRDRKPTGEEVGLFIFGLTAAAILAARNYLASLMRQTWDSKASSLGLLPYQLSSGRTAWFVPTGLVANDQVLIVDEKGISHRKKLSGFSARKSVYWHFALELRPAIHFGRASFALRAHVIFSSDGTRPVESAARMHVLRRSFCKSWWNDRWRDLTIAYLTMLRGAEADRITMSIGDTTQLVADASMVRLVAPVSVVEEEDVMEGWDDEPADFEDSDDEDDVMTVGGLEPTDE